MGGTKYGMGNITLAGEFNFISDPEAAQIVIDRMKMTYLLPWEVAYDNNIETDKDKERMMDDQFEPCKLFKAINKINDEIDGKIYCCDGLAAACAIDPTMIKEQKVMEGKVCLQGEDTRGGIFFNWYPLFVGKPEKKNVTLILDIHFDKYLNMLEDSLKH